MWCLGWEIRSCRRGRRNVRRRRLRLDSPRFTFWTTVPKPASRPRPTPLRLESTYVSSSSTFPKRTSSSRTFSRTHIRRWRMLNAVSTFTPIFPLVLLRLCPLKVSRISVFHWSTFWWEYHVRRPLSYVNLLPHDVHLNICLPLPAWAVPAFGTDLHTICRR